MRLWSYESALRRQRFESCSAQDRYRLWATLSTFKRGPVRSHENVKGAM
jgi:hypothetical protein